MVGAMANLSARERAKLPASAFAYVDSSGQRRLPIHDEAHVRAALGRFNRVAFEDEAARDQARTRLLRAAKRFGIVPLGFIDGQLRPHRHLPTGTITLLFADIEDSTEHVAALAERYGPMITAVRRLLRTEVRRHGGHEVDARADEYLAAFTAADGALAAATAIQRAMASAALAADRRIRVRIGLHTGRPTLTATGYVGLAVHTGSRICDAGHGGQILLSGAAAAALDEPDATALRGLGRHRLRGINDRQELFQVLGDGLEHDFPALRLDHGPTA
jgi:class 3 adenylate cyclase